MGGWVVGWVVGLLSGFCAWLGTFGCLVANSFCLLFISFVLCCTFSGAKDTSHFSFYTHAAQTDGLVRTTSTGTTETALNTLLSQLNALQIDTNANGSAAVVGGGGVAPSAPLSPTSNNGDASTPRSKASSRASSLRYCLPRACHLCVVLC
jgi:hypothetical protein